MWIEASPRDLGAVPIPYGVQDCSLNCKNGYGRYVLSPHMVKEKMNIFVIFLK